MDALLIVDMQNACFDDADRYQKEDVIKNINRLADRFRTLDAPVIHIQHEESEGTFLRDSEGWHIISGIKTHVTDHYVSKTCCDAFIQTKLLQLLKDQSISRVLITGCATDFCVDSTIKGAIAAQLNVMIPSDAHTTADRPHICAEALIQHYNWNWKNLISGKSTIQVLPTNQALAEFVH